MRRRDC